MFLILSHSFPLSLSLSIQDILLKNHLHRVWLCEANSRVPIDVITFTDIIQWILNELQKQS
jgi:hypothetical protein